jgi:hypothetical protein
MSKSSEAHLDGASGQSASGGSGDDSGEGPGDDSGESSEEASGDARKARKRQGAAAGDAATRRARFVVVDAVDEAEHLQQDLARVRARGATDPALASRSLSGAWTTDVLEQDEAEFVDAVADCLGAGFSLDSALTGWDMGTLAAEGLEEAALLDDDTERDDETIIVARGIERRHAPSGRRLFIT